MLTQSADRSIRAYNLKPRGASGSSATLKLASRGIGGSGGNPQVAKMHGGYEVVPVQEEAYRELTGADFEKKKSPAGKNLFADYTVPSFFRRLAFSPDGNLIIAPTGIFRNMSLPESPQPSPDLEASLKAIKGNFCTHVFSRWNIASPILSLAGLDEPSVAVRFSPVLYELVSSPAESEPRSLIPGDYRAVFAVITLRSLFVYDTQHPYPLAKIGGFHLACINDATWSADGRLLTVCSSDGYLSFVRFAKGSLGVPLKASEIPEKVKAGAEYLHKYTRPVVEPPQPKAKKVEASGPEREGATAPPAVGSPERIAEALRIHKENDLDAVASKSPTGSDSATKRKRLTPVPVSEPEGVAMKMVEPSATGPMSAEKTLEAIKASSAITADADKDKNSSSSSGSSSSSAGYGGAGDAAEGGDDAAKKKRRIAPTLVTNLKGISASSSSSSGSDSSSNDGVAVTVLAATAKASEAAVKSTPEAENSVNAAA